MLQHRFNVPWWSAASVLRWADPATLPEEVMMAEDTPRYDILIVGQRRNQRIPEQTVRALIQNMTFAGIATTQENVALDNATEVYLVPSHSAHEAFLQGAFKGAPPVFVEAVLRFGDAPATHTYQGKEIEAVFHLEFRGCLFQAPNPRFRKMLKQSLNIRAEVFTQAHQGIPERPQPVTQADGPTAAAQGPEVGLARTRVEEI